MPASSLSSRLAEAIAPTGLDATGLAKKVGTTQATISNWLNDKVQIDHVKAAVLLRMCDELDVRPNWLLFGTGRMRASDPEPQTQSQAVKSETLTMALQLVDDALKAQGAALPTAKRAEVTSLVYELLEEGMPEAKVLRFARAAAA